MEDLINELKIKVIEHLNLQELSPEDISADDPLFGDGIGLDSIDALELIVLLQQDYGIKVTDAEEGRQAFRSIRTMAEFIKSKQAQ